MYYLDNYQSPLGNITIKADEEYLIGLWFESDNEEKTSISNQEKSSEIKYTKEWLNIYFNGDIPNFMPKIRLIGTPFQILIWNMLLKIPYGKTTTYKEIAIKVAKEMNLSTMSAQAVGGAIGKNKISIIIPCHRVIGTNNSLTGYAWGIDRKLQLLGLEKVDTSKLTM